MFCLRPHTSSYSCQHFGLDNCSYWCKSRTGRRCAAERKASYAGRVSRRSGAVEATGVIGTVDAVGSRRRIVSHDAMTE